MFFISTVAGYVKNSVVLSKNESYFACLREFLVPAVEMIPIGCSATAPLYMTGLAMHSTLVATERKIW